MLYSDLCRKMDAFWMLFLTASSAINSGKIQIIACETGKRYLFKTFLFLGPTFKTCHFWTSWPKKKLYTSKKALLLIVWKKFWNWTNFCHERLQMSFSRSGLKKDSLLSTKTLLEPSMTKVLSVLIILSQWVMGLFF